MLDDPQPRWRAFGASTTLQVLLLILVSVGPMLFPQRLIPVMRYEVIPLALPRTQHPLPPKPQPERVKVQPPPEPVEPPKVVKLFAPARPLAPKPKPKPEMAAPAMKPVFEGPNLNTARAEPKRPREDVKTGVLTTGSAARATVNRPLNQVQTGGFGDPEGIPAGKSNPGKRANIAQKGSFDLPGGPGYGNGTGGASGVRGTVASAGFGSGIAIPPKGSGGGGGGRGAVREGGFADATAATTAEAPRARSSSGAGATQPVEIVEKPNPVYTEEARRRRIEGEVLVDVVFTASGEVRVIRVLRGLGYGLDEAALRAAQHIRFKPARRDGQPVDFPATVHIIFQLAY